MFRTDPVYDASYSVSSQILQVSQAMKLLPTGRSKDTTNQSARRTRRARTQAVATAKVTTAAQRLKDEREAKS